MRPTILILAIALAVALAGCAGPAPEYRLTGVYRCGSDLALDAWQAGDSLRLESVDRHFELDRVQSASGAHWEGDGVVFHEKEKQAVFTRDGESRQCRLDESLMQAIERGVDYRAVGQEPGWLLEITGGESIFLAYDYAEHTATLPYVEPANSDDGRTYRIDAGDTQVEVEIVSRRCHDAMSGLPYPHSVTVRYRSEDTERTLEGCGRALPK